LLYDIIETFIISAITNRSISLLRAESIHSSGIVVVSKVSILHASGMFYCLKFWPDQVTNLRSSPSFSSDQLPKPPYFLCQLWGTVKGLESSPPCKLVS
jgi:hypothetical protein